jgi:hypothetical protein
MSDLKLIAFDGEDLEVVSAHVQDALVRVADMGFSKSDNRFVCLLNRYAWEKNTIKITNKITRKNKGERHRAALRFDYVKNVRTKGFDLNSQDGVLELLSITFEPNEMPEGVAILNFAGGATLALELECLEVRLHDLGAAWSAKARPKHDI